MIGTAAVFLLFLFSLKHFVFDFLYQPPWMYLTKGNYGSWGGIAHSGIHALATVVMFLLFPYVAFGTAVAIGLVEFMVHYHMDWYKVWLCKREGWTCTTSENYFRMLGADQFVHMLTYLGIVYWIAS